MQIKGEGISLMPEDNIATQRERKMAAFLAMADNPNSDVHLWRDAAIEAGLARNTPLGRERLTNAMGALTTVVITETIPVPNDPHGIGWRECRANELRLSQIRRNFGLKGINLKRLVPFLVRFGAIQPKLDK